MVLSADEVLRFLEASPLLKTEKIVQRLYQEHQIVAEDDALE